MNDSRAFGPIIFLVIYLKNLPIAGDSTIEHYVPYMAYHQPSKKPLSKNLIE